MFPFNWAYDGLKITNSSGVHAKKAGEFGLMSVLMLQNHIPKIVTNQKNKDFISTFGNPIAGKNIVLIGTGSLGSSMAKLVAPLGAKWDRLAADRLPGVYISELYDSGAA